MSGTKAPLPLWGPFTPPFARLSLSFRFRSPSIFSTPCLRQRDNRQRMPSNIGTLSPTKNPPRGAAYPFHSDSRDLLLTLRQRDNRQKKASNIGTRSLPQKPPKVRHIPFILIREIFYLTLKQRDNHERSAADRVTFPSPTKKAAVRHRLRQLGWTGFIQACPWGYFTSPQ